MNSPLKKAVVYDLETGGLSETYGSITEIAMVTIDLETLEKIDELSFMIKPRVRLSTIEEDNFKEAKNLYKRLGVKDDDTGIKTLSYGDSKITLKNLDPLVEGIEAFKERVVLKNKEGVLLNDEIQELLKTDLKNIVQVYVNSAYNPQALEVTKISYDMLVEGGIEFEDAFKKVDEFIKKHTVGNSKPIISGHNIGWLPRRIVKGKEVKPNGFDNPFMEVFFKENKADFFSSVNDIFYDTLNMARLKWTELSSYSLGVVAHELGITLTGAHRALADTRSNADVLIQMLRSLRGNGSSETKYKRKKFKLNF